MKSWLGNNEYPSGRVLDHTVHECACLSWHPSPRALQLFHHHLPSPGHTDWGCLLEKCIGLSSWCISSWHTVSHFLILVLKLLCEMGNNTNLLNLYTLKSWPPLENQALLLMDFGNHVPPRWPAQRRNSASVISPPCWAIHPIRAIHKDNGGSQESASRPLFLLYQSLEMSCQERSKYEGLEDKARRYRTGKGHKAWGQNKKGGKGFYKAQQHDKLGWQFRSPFHDACRRLWRLLRGPQGVSTGLEYARHCVRSWWDPAKEGYMVSELPDL